jgi:NTP pyrophosphatase (non-canonical NTP hydrolase)
VADSCRIYLATAICYALKMDISEFQKIISEKYEERDRQRGTARTFLWFIEEVGELATALASGDDKNKSDEFADVFAWLCTLANINDVDLEKACEKYTKNNPTGFKPK